MQTSMVNVDVSYWKKYKMWYDKEKGNADEHDKDLKQVLLNNETGIGVIGALIMGASASALTIDFDEPASAVVAAYCGIMFASTMLAIAAVVYASLIFLNVNKLPASCVIHYWERAVVLPGDSLLLVLFSLALFFLGIADAGVRALFDCGWNRMLLRSGGNRAAFSIHLCSTGRCHGKDGK